MPLFGKPNICELEQKRDIKELIKILKHEEGSLREEAMEALGRIGEEAIAPLINELRKLPSTGTTVRFNYEIAGALGKIGKPAIEPLIAAIREQHLCLRANAALALSYVGEPAINSLIKLFLDPDRNLLGLASLALSKIGAPAVEPLIRALTDDNDQVRIGAAVALSSICDRGTIEPLRRALKDSNRWVRLYSAVALAKIDASEIQAIQLLKEAAQDYGSDSSDYRGVAAFFLEQIQPTKKT